MFTPRPQALSRDAACALVKALPELATATVEATEDATTIDSGCTGSRWECLHWCSVHAGGTAGPGPAQIHYVGVQPIGPAHEMFVCPATKVEACWDGQGVIAIDAWRRGAAP